MVILRTILQDVGERFLADEAAMLIFPAMHMCKYTPTHSEDKLLDLSLERRGQQPGLSAPLIYDAARHHY